MSGDKVYRIDVYINDVRLSNISKHFVPNGDVECKIVTGTVRSVDAQGQPLSVYVQSVDDLQVSEYEAFRTWSHSIRGAVQLLKAQLMKDRDKVLDDAHDVARNYDKLYDKVGMVENAFTD